MKRLLTLMCAVLVLFGIGLVPALSEGKEADPMELWQKLATPGDMHKLLSDYCVGDFVIKSKMWMDPKGEPLSSEGTCKGEMVFGGRYLKETINLKNSEKKFEFNGMGLIGYDNGSEQFVHTFICDMGTGLDRFNGQYDEKTKTITFEGQGYIKDMGGTFSSRAVLTLVSKDERKIEMFTRYGKMDEVKEMELSITRKK